MILSQRVKDLILGLFGGDPDNQNEIVSGLSGVFLQNNGVDAVSFNDQQTVVGGVEDQTTDPAIMINSDQFSTTDTFSVGSTDSNNPSTGTTILYFTSGANTAINASEQTGNVWLTSGSVTETPSTASSGFLGINSGYVAGSGSSGEIVIQSGDNIGNGETADVYIQTGQASNNVSGDVHISGGVANSSSQGGSIIIESGPNDGAGTSGYIEIATTQSVLGSSGEISLGSGNTTENGANSGVIELSTGVGQAQSGHITFTTGVSGTQNSGDIDLTTGRMSGSGGASSGSINLLTGDVNVGNGSGQTGNITLTTGPGTSGHPTPSGDIILTTGLGNGPRGTIQVSPGIQFMGSTSGYVDIQATSTPISYTINLPSAQATAPQILSNDGSGNLSWDQNGNVDPSQMQFLYEDWTASSVNGNTNWSGTTSGGGSFQLAPNSVGLDFSKHPGVVDIYCAANGSRADLDMLNKVWLCGNGQLEFESLIYLGLLATATEDYVTWIGFGDTRTGFNVNNGFYFQYDRSSNINWQIISAAGGTNTITDTSVPVAAGQWIKLKAICNANASSITYYINGASVGAINTNIPSTSGSNEFYFVHFIAKTASSSSTQEDLYVDYTKIQKLFTTNR